MSGDKMMMLIMFGLFLFLAITMITVTWYNKKHQSKLDPVRILLILFAIIVAGFWFLIKKLNTSEKGNIIQNMSLRNTVVDITFEKRKPYFKDMKLDDGRWLPMPEEMNSILQIGDSIYKNKNENFYTIVNPNTKKRTNFEVKTHLRVLGKPQ